MIRPFVSVTLAFTTALLFGASLEVYAGGGPPASIASVSQAFSNTPPSFNPGDGADQISIAIANSNSSIDLSSSLQVNGTLSGGITVNAPTFVSGDWNCASGSGGSAFTCTRQTPLAANASDAILVPVAVAANASTGSGSLTDVIFGGGLTSPVNGTDPLTISVTPLFVSCARATTGQVGVAFSTVPMSASGGMTPYTYAVAGTLTPGLTLDPSTGALTGTPTAPGSFSVQVTDAAAASGPSTCPVAVALPPSGQCSIGQANAYSLISLSGNIADAADITGRIAAAGQVTQATTIGSDLRTGDPFMGFASAHGGPWAIVAGEGIPTSDSFNINAGGNVFSSTATSATFNFVNEEYAGSSYSGSSLVTGSPSPVDFASLSTDLQALSGYLNAAPANGATCSVDNFGAMIPGPGCPANPVYFNPNSQHYNPSWTVLYGTRTTTNIFNITQDQFGGSNNLDIEVPTGSTVIVNVPGTSNTLQSDVYFQGNTVTDANAGTILFNFPAAASLTINGQLDGTVLAPSAALSGLSQMGGVFIASSVGPTGEVHYDPFVGSIPSEICSPASTTPLSVTCAAVTTGDSGRGVQIRPMTVSGGTAPVHLLHRRHVARRPEPEHHRQALITGTPTASGTFSVKVTDANGATSRVLPYHHRPVHSRSTCATVTTGEVGVAFDSGPITVSGGTLRTPTPSWTTCLPA